MIQVFARFLLVDSRCSLIGPVARNMRNARGKFTLTDCLGRFSHTLFEEGPAIGDCGWGMVIAKSSNTLVGADDKL